VSRNKRGTSFSFIWSPKVSSCMKIWSFSSRFPLSLVRDIRTVSGDFESQCGKMVSEDTVTTSGHQTIRAGGEYPEHVLDPTAASSHHHQAAEGHEVPLHSQLDLRGKGHHKVVCRQPRRRSPIITLIGGMTTLKLEGCPFITTLAAAMFFQS